MSRSRVQRQVECDVCHKRFDIGKVCPVGMVQGPVLERIKHDNPEAGLHGYVCLDDLADYRQRLVHDILAGEQTELTTDAKVVLASLENEENLLARDAYGDYDQQITTGERIADRVATFGGSWAFIISFGAVLFVWIAINTIGLLQRPFDPFPYILLNLVLSCLAAIQAPVIMMSQNRKEAKDRLHSENDYRINMKAELEIRSLHSKLDLLISHQWQRLLEIQEIQTEMLEELTSKRQA